MKSLYSANSPQRFWRCLINIPNEQWQTAIERSLHLLPETFHNLSSVDVIAAVLGEVQFRENHWTLDTSRRLYYKLKPLLPRSLTNTLRKLISNQMREDSALDWPVEKRYAHFQWNTMRKLLSITEQTRFPFIHFWPEGQRYAFILTHDVETATGQAYVRQVADLEANLGFRSSFNFIPERYTLNENLLHELRERGFEIGVHGLKHDGKLFSSRDEFLRRALRINKYLQEIGAVGFRAPFTIRNPEWMQELDIEYDLSFFDTDPFEPMPGGTMSIWPFEIGNFIEMPYTLVQDNTLINILNEMTPEIWLNKVDFVEEFYGMALVNTHPDYLLNPTAWDVYTAFLQTMNERGGYWHALPKDAAHWWRARADAESNASLPGAVQGEIYLDRNDIVLKLNKESSKN